MKLILVLPLLAAALAARDRYPALSTVWPPSVTRPLHAPSLHTPGLTYEAASSYASVPSSFVSGSSPTASPPSFALLTVKRPVPSFALASVKKPAAYHAPAHSYAYAPVKTHNYDWSVREGGNSFGHKESNDGYTTKGAYYVDLPDGRRQKVTYYVSGDSGYVAEVSYEGVPYYPAPKHAYYKPVLAAHAQKYLVSSAHISSLYRG